MEKLLTELNKIYTKLGGLESDIPATKKNDLEFIVDKIEDKVGSGGGGTQDPFAAYDVVIKINDEPEAGYQWEIVKFNEDEVINKFNNHIPIIGFAYSYQPNNGRDDRGEVATWYVTNTFCRTDKFDGEIVIQLTVEIYELYAITEPPVITLYYDFGHHEWYLDD